MTVFTSRPRTRRADALYARACLRAFTRRQYQAHGRTLAAALPLDLAAELLGEALDQPAAEPGVGASRIDALAVVGDRQAKLPGTPA